MKLSNKLLQFHYKFKSFAAYIIAHATELMISTDQKAVVSDDWTDWDEKMTTYTTPDTHNTASISDINRAYELYAPLVETISVQIRDNKAIELTGADMINLDIKPVDKTRSRIDPPNFAPSIGLISNGHLELEIFAFDPKQPAKKPKPAGARFIGSEVAYTVPSAPEPNDKDYATRAPEGKTIFSILYSSDKVGMKIWVKVWYMSPTGKPGPKSMVFSIVLV